MFKAYDQRMKIDIFSKFREKAFLEKREHYKTKKLTKFVHAIKISYLRQALSSWRVVNYNKVTITMFESIKNFEESKIVHQKEIEHLYKEKYRKVEKFMDLRKRGLVFTKWFHATRFRAIIKKKSEYLKDQLASNKMKNLLLKWRDRNQVTKRMRRTLKMAKTNYKQNILSKTINAWREHNYAQRNLIKGISRLFKTYDNLALSYGYNQIRHFGESRVARKQVRKKHAVSDISFVLNNIYKRKIQSCLNDLKLRSIKVKHDKNL